MNTIQKMKKMRVYLTERCNANCPNCANARGRSNIDMSDENFERLCAYLSENGIKTLKIMGGEPTVHDNFEKLVEIAISRFDYIEIFSNGLNDKVKNLHLRPKDCVIYNFLFNKNFSKERLYLESGGERAFHTQVHASVNEKELAERLVSLVSIDRNRIGVALSMDCASNIFKDRSRLIEKLSYMECMLMEQNIPYFYDHAVPRCFSRNSGLHFYDKGFCDVSISGAIGADMTLRFCNNHPEKLISLLDGSDFVPWKTVTNQLESRYAALRKEARETICAGCPEFEKSCNGGCWIPSSRIKRDDVLKFMD